MIWRFVAVVAAALVLAGPAAACARPRTSLAFLEGQVMCPVCHTTLDMSDAPVARHIKGYIARRIAACWTAQRIEDALIAQFGPAILAEPSHKGFDLVAWWLPIGGVLGGGLILAYGVWRWSRGRDDEPPAGESGLDDETERKIDDLLAEMD